MYSKLRFFLNKTISVSGYKYKIADFLFLLITSATSNNFIESTSKSYKFPNADTLHLKLKNISLQNILLYFDNVIDSMIRSLPRNIWKVPVTIAIDETYEPFYGSKHKMTKWIFGYKSVNGATGCYKFAVLSIVCGDKKFVIAVVPIVVGTPKVEYTKQLITLAKSKIKVKLVLLDRGFYSAEIYDYLTKNKLKFICLAHKNSATKKYIEKTVDQSCVVHKIEYSKDFSTNKVFVKLFIIKDYKQFDWIFASNVVLENNKDYLYFYKKRWGIETTFRVCDVTRIPSKSKIMNIRLFLFVFSSLLYNIWTFFKKEKMSFATFMLKVMFDLYLCTICKTNNTKYLLDIYTDKDILKIFV